MHRWNSDQTSEKQSQLWTVSTESLEKSDLNQSFFNNTKGGIRILLPVPSCAQWNENWWSSFFEKFVVARSFTAESNLQLAGVCEQNTLTRHFSRVCTQCLSMLHVTWAQGVCARHVIHVSCALCGCLIPLRLSTLHSSQSLPSSIWSSWSSSSLSMWVGSERSTLCASANEDVWLSGQQRPSHSQEGSQTVPHETASGGES